MEYEGGRGREGFPVNNDPAARHTPSTVSITAKRRYPRWQLIAATVCILSNSACVFDGLTGSRPDANAIGFALNGPDTIGIDDTLSFSLDSVRGLLGTEPGLRVLWSSTGTQKANWVQDGAAPVSGAGVFVANGLDPAALFGLDTGSTWIVARVIAPELPEGIVDSVEVAVAPKLTFLTQPRDSFSTGETLGVSVAVVDGRGTVVTTPRRITLSLGLLGGNDSLVRVIDRANEAATFYFGDSIVPTTDGIATFDSVRIYTPGSGYTLVAASGKLTRAASTPFRVGQLILRARAGDGQADTVDTQVEIAPLVELVNELGRPVPGRRVSFRVAAGGGQLSDNTAMTNDSGWASVDWRLGIVADSANNIVEATVDNAGDVQPVLFRATALPDRPAKLEVLTPPSSVAVCRVPFNTQPVIELLDRFDNRNRDSLIVISAVLSNGNSTLLGTSTATTGANGRATFSDLAIDGSTGAFDLEFTAPALGTTDPETVQLSTGTASQLQIVTQPPDTVESDTNFPNQNAPEVRLSDACNNPRSSSQITATIAPGMGTLDGDSTVNTGSDGIAEFRGLSIVPQNMTPGNYPFVMTFSIGDPTVTPVVSDTIVVTVPSPSPGPAPRAIDPPDPPEYRRGRR